MDIYKRLHADDGIGIGKRMKRDTDEHEIFRTKENSKIIDKSDNIITFTAKG